jgi:hypothetical protein
MMRKPLLAAMLCALMAVLPAWAQTYKDSGGTVVPGVVPIPATVGGTASLAVTNASGTVAIPASDSLYPSINLTNSGSVALFYALGPTATTSSAYLGPGSSACIAAGSATTVAAITASSTTTLQLAQTNSCIYALNGGGGGGGGGSGTVTSVGLSASDGLLSVGGSPVTTSGTLTLGVVGASGGVPYFNTSASWASSAALAANSLMVGGGARVAPSTVTTNATVLTALGATPTGSGGIVLATSPALVTPALGAATATSLAIGGATLGSNALAVTGLANFASVGSASAPSLSVGNQTTGFYSVSTTQLGFAVNGVSVLNYGATAGTWTTTAAVTVGSVTSTTNMSFTGNITGVGGTSGYYLGASFDTILTRHAAATWQLGAADAAAPVAQTLGVQNVVAGTSNTAGASWTMNGSVSTGSGTSGDIIFKTGGTGAGAAVQNAEITALTIKGATQNVQLNGITTDATHTDATVCEDTTSHGLYFGSGTAGICLGTSSARFKHDITALDAGLSQIMALQPRRYFLNPGHGDTQKPYYGFLAEDGAGVLPELTGYDAQGRPNTFDYLGIVPVLVRAVQEQQAEITALRGQTRASAQ